MCVYGEGKKKGKESDTEGYRCISSLSSCLASENQWRRVVSGLLSSTSFSPRCTRRLHPPPVLTLPFSFPSLFHSKPVTRSSFLFFTTRPCPFFSSSAVYWFIHAMFRCLAKKKEAAASWRKKTKQNTTACTLMNICVCLCVPGFIFCAVRIDICGCFYVCIKCVLLCAPPPPGLCVCTVSLYLNV